MNQAEIQTEGPSEIRHVRVGRHDVTVSVVGELDDLPPLVMLNGVGAEYRLWGEFRRQMTRPTIAFDVRSEFLGIRPSMRTFAHFVNATMDTLDLPVADVLGLSWGGMASQESIHRHPGRVRRLVLAATTPGFVSVPGRPASLPSLLSPNRSPEKMRRSAKTFYGGDIKANPDIVHELGLVRTLDSRLYRRQLAACLGWTSVGWLGGVRQPTLILAGSDDPIIPVANSRLMHTLIPNSQLLVIDDGGHLFLLTRPAQMAAVISRFLTQE